MTHKKEKITEHLYITLCFQKKKKNIDTIHVYYIVYFIFFEIQAYFKRKRAPKCMTSVGKCTGIVCGKTQNLILRSRDHKVAPVGRI